MGVQVLSPESHHTKHLRSLPRIPQNSHYSMKPYTTAKPSRGLPNVPNVNVNKMENTVKPLKAMPRITKQMDNKKLTVVRTGRKLPDVPFREVAGSFKDTNTSGSSRTSTPRHTLNTSVNTQHSNNQPSTSNHGPQRHLPKLPKLLQKPKPEQNRIEYMHSMYKKEGDGYGENGQYEQAVKSYNLALKFISDEKTTIIARSRAYRKLQKLRKAMQDADLALKLDPLYHEGLLQKAELLLEQGDHENALNYFQMGARIRPDKDDFHDGIEKAKHGAKKRKNTLSPEDNPTQKKVKDKDRKNRENRAQQRMKSYASDDLHNNSYGSHGSSTQHESVIQEEGKQHVPAPPPNPPPLQSRTKLRRTMTPMPGRFKSQQQEARPTQHEHAHHEHCQELHQQRHTSDTNHHFHQRTSREPQAPPGVEDMDEATMKRILGTLSKDKDYLEKLLGANENITLPGTTNVGTSAQTGLHFLYDRVLNWVRKGEAVPFAQPTPLPRETKTSAKRKTLAHGSSVESIMEEYEKENEVRLRRRYRKKGQSKAPHTWYNYLENKKLEEAHERKNVRNVFLHVVEGRKIKPKEHSNLEPQKMKGEGRRAKENGMRQNKEHGSKDSLVFHFTAYRPGSDMQSSSERKNTPMEISEPEDQPQKTPPRKLRHYGGANEKKARHQRALLKFVTKEVEETEYLYAEGRYDECVDKALHVLRKLEHEDLEEKFPYMALLHSYVGNVCIGRRDFERGLEHHNKDLKIGEKHNLEEAVSRALGNLGRVYVVQKRHQEALEVFLRKTPMCASRTETAWLFHEIGNCFLALGDFEYAKDAAKKSLEAAEEALEWSYQLQSCVLMGVAEVKLKQYHAAFNTFENALDQAKIQGDEKAEEAIRDALQDVNDRIVEEMRTKGPLNFAESRTDNTLTPLSRSTTTVTEYQLQGLSRSRAEIAKMQAELGPRFRADYAKTPGAQSEYSSIVIPEDDGDVSLTDTPDLNIDLERLRTESTIFGSALDLRDHIRSETFVSGKGK